VSSNVIRLVPPVVGDDFTVALDQILTEAQGAYADLVLIGVTKDGEMRVASSGGLPTRNGRQGWDD
jgi:hypothetical protein